MTIKSSQSLVKEALAQIKTISSDEAKKKINDKEKINFNTNKYLQQNPNISRKNFSSTNHVLVFGK